MNTIVICLTVIICFYIIVSFVNNIHKRKTEENETINDIINDICKIKYHVDMMSKYETYDSKFAAHFNIVKYMLKNYEDEDTEQE